MIMPYIYDDTGVAFKAAVDALEAMEEAQDAAEIAKQYGWQAVVEGTTLTFTSKEGN